MLDLGLDLPQKKSDYIVRKPRYMKKLPAAAVDLVFESCQHR